MAIGDDAELIDRFEEFYRNYYRDEIGQLAQRYPNEQRSLYIDWSDLYRYDPAIAEDFLAKPGQMREYAEEALRLYDLPVDVKLGGAHVRMENLGSSTGIREIRSDHVGNMVASQGIVRKATDVRPKMQEAAFECQRCGTLTRIPQSGSGFQEPHQCGGCERQGPFKINFDQSEFVDAQKLRIQESPEGLRGGETPQAIDVNIEDDITGRVTAGDHVTAIGILHLEQQGSNQEKTSIFDFYMEGLSITIEDEQFEEMEISEQEEEAIVELSRDPEIYEKMVDSMAPSIFGYEMPKLAIIMQLFSGVRKALPDSSRIRGDIHILMIGDPGTGKSQILQYVKKLAPRSVYTSGKGSSSAGLTAAAVRDDFGDGQQWSLEAGALVLADQGVAAVDELDKMRCVTGDTLVHCADGSITRIGELAREAAEKGEIASLSNGRTIRDVELSVWTMTDSGRLVRRPVTAVHEYDAPETLTRVILDTGEQLTATEDHPFLLLESGERVERPAIDLQSGDWVYVPGAISPPVSDGGTAVAESGAEPRAGSSEKALAAVVGYLSGDGTVHSSRGAGYGIRFANAEEELLADFEDACETAFDARPYRAPSEGRPDGVETVRLDGRDPVQTVLDRGMTLETSDRKSFPSGVTELTRSAKATFVRALADSEGSVDADRGNVKIHSSSRELLTGTRQLLLEFGVRSQLQTSESDTGRELSLAITAADSVAAYASEVGFTLTQKRDALDEALGKASGDRPILDLIPEMGPWLRETRASLRLPQSECGLNVGTYGDFERGDANPSAHRAALVLDAFEARKRSASADREQLDEDASWGTLSRLRERYHLPQSQIADGTAYAQQQVSTLWGQDDDLRRCVADRLRTVLEAVAATDLSKLRELSDGDVGWRRVSAVETVEPSMEDDRNGVLSENLRRLLGETELGGEERARRLLDREPEIASEEGWKELRTELERHAVSMASVASEIGVAQSTVSGWCDGVVETDRFSEVRGAAMELIRQRRRRVAELLTEIDERRRPKVYDLTVEETHNFLANGMVVHNSEDQSAMHEALEQQEISISKAGINATLKARCSLLGAANPTYGRFDEYEPVSEQIDLEPPLISRFDLIFTVTDKPDADRDRDLAEHIIKTNYAGELNTHRGSVTTSNVSQSAVDAVSEEVIPEIEPDLLRKYIAYAKRHCYPTMSEEAKAAIQEFYVDMRSRGDGDGAIPVTARKLEALVRLAEASARIRLSDEVTTTDTERVIEIVRSSMEDVGMDPETGEFDADMIEAGASKSQRDRIKNVKGIIRELQDEYDDGAPLEDVLERAEQGGIERTKAEHEIQKLKDRGDIYEPRSDHLRVV